MRNRKILVSLIVLSVVELLTVYFWTFLFMLEGAPGGHNAYYLNVAATVCIVVFLLAPFGWVIWFVSSSDSRHLIDCDCEPLVLHVRQKCVVQNLVLVTHKESETKTAFPSFLLPFEGRRWPTGRMRGLLRFCPFSKLKPPTHDLSPAGQRCEAF